MLRVVILVDSTDLQIKKQKQMWAWARNLHVTKTSYPTAPRLPVGTGRRWYVARLGSDPHSLTAFGTGGAATRAGSAPHGRGRTPGRWRGTRAQRVLPCPGCHRCWLHWLRRYSPRRRGGPEGTTPEWPAEKGGGGHDKISDQSENHWFESSTFPQDPRPVWGKHLALCSCRPLCMPHNMSINNTHESGAWAGSVSVDGQGLPIWGVCSRCFRPWNPGCMQP